jgi:hypothetical protein
LAESLGERFAVELSTDEDEIARSLLGAPRAVLTCVEEHVDALENEAAIGAGDVQDALHAEDIGAIFAQQCRQPRVQSLEVQRLVEVNADRGHFRVVRVRSGELLLGDGRERLPEARQAQPKLAR